MRARPQQPTEAGKRTRFFWLCALVLGSAGVIGLSGGCGARTRLPGAYPCQQEGEVIDCQGVCGAGTKECVAGFWTSCDIPETEEPCENVCGAGLRTCANERWSECRVEPVSESCDNTCGEGTRSCVDAEWSECFVEPTEVICETVCGEGVADCRDDTVGECRVERVEEACTFGCGPGVRVCEDGLWQQCNAPRPRAPYLRATIRDFLDTHPDMERVDAAGVDPGIVEERLGPDEKPVYAGGPTLTTTNEANFNQWFRDVEGVNQRTEIELPLTELAGGFYRYANPDFFPIDGQLFGNQGRVHNYHFTLEASGEFVYQSGQVFSFDGDDDLWVFINGFLAIDLGGLHQSLYDQVELDDVAADANLVEGNTYELHIFFAERKTVASNFTIETSISGLGECE